MSPRGYVMPSACIHRCSTIKILIAAFIQRFHPIRPIQNLSFGEIFFFTELPFLIIDKANSLQIYVHARIISVSF